MIFISTEASIVPRFRFEGWAEKDFVALLSTTAEAEALSELLVDKCR
jgi:hypothetical protein